jgi:hypothetical protein
MSNILKGLAEVQSTMLITDPNRDKIIMAMSEIKKLQAENAELTKREQYVKALINQSWNGFNAVDLIDELNKILKGDSDE